MKKYFYSFSITFLIILLGSTSSRGQVVINELGIAPACASCNAAGGGEFIELFNAGCSPVDISCYVLVWTGISGGANPTGWTVLIPPGTTLPSCGYYVIGGSNKSGNNWADIAPGAGGNPWDNPAGAVNQEIDASYCTSLQTCQPGNLVDTQGQINLLDATGTVVWSVSYNSGNDPGSYPANTNTASPCAVLNPINALPNSANNVNGTWGSGHSQGIELGSSGTYVATTVLTPGAANSTAGQMACSSGGPTALATTPAKTGCVGSTGSVTIGATTGGTGPFTYNFNNLGYSSTTTYTGLAAGTYTVLVKDSHGCTFSTTATVGTSTSPTALATTPTNTSCGGATGSVTIGATTGGTGPFTYNFNSLGFSATTTFNNLAAGAYPVIVKDANGCTFSTTATVGNNAGPTALATTPTNSSCGGTTGSVTIGATTGGTGPFTYNFNSLGFSATTTFNNLAAGAYSVIVKDANGCTFSTTATVGNNTGPTALATTPTNSSCGGTTGSVTIGATTGGTGPFTYNFNSLGFSATTTYNNLAAGAYTVIVKDANGCIFSTTATVGNNTGPTALATTPTNSSCGGTTGSVTIGATTGGTGPFTYNFNSLGFSATTTYNNLGAGAYPVIVKDANGCIFSTTATVGNNTGPAALATTPTNSSCGGTTGSVTIGATTGGTGPFTYNFNSLGFSATTTFNNLAAGVYPVIVKDANGCTFSTTATVGNNTGPTALATTPTNSSCGGTTGSVTIGATTGGTGPFTYNFNSLGFSATTSFSNLASGTYPVVVKDANGCIFSTSVIVGNNSGPTALAATPTNSSCGTSNGIVTIGATTGGTGPFTYNFNSLGFSATTTYSNLAAGTYPVIVKDANGCTFSTTATVGNNTGPSVASSAGNNSLCNAACTGSATVNATGGNGTLTYSWSPSGGAAATTTSTLCAGIYTCTIKDALGCVVTQTVTLTDPAAVAVTIQSTTSATCNTSNGAATVNVTGGTGAYTYAWSPVGGTAATASGLPAGSYNVLVTDANSCPKNLTINISNLNGPSAALGAVSNITCNASCNGSASVSVTGGTGAYTYSWSPSGGVASSAAGLCQGNYVCTIRDSNNCLTTQSVTITQPGPLASVPSNTAVSCNNGSNGSASVAVTGGTVNYTYSWSPSGGTGSNASGLSAGTYSCTVTDLNGCSVVSTIIISQPSALASSAAGMNPTCGASNGSAVASTSGGTGAYTYSWSPSGGAGDTASSLPAGNYICTITDANGCLLTDTARLTNTGLPPVATITPASSTTFCQGQSVLLQAGGGGTYSWSNGSTTDTITVSAAGNYTVVVTNSCGTSPATTAITVNSLPVANVSGDSSSCAGVPVTLTASGGTSYSWSTGNVTPSIVVATSGTYTATVTNGCGAATSSFVVNFSSVLAHYTADSTAGYAPFNVLFTNNSSANATSWIWNFGDGGTGSGPNPTHIYPTAGTYTAVLTVTNAKGCTSTYDEIITVTDIPSWIVVPNVFTPNGDGINDLLLCRSKGIDQFEMKIYDRWGLEIALIESVNQGWDGRTKAGMLASDGTYYYIMHAKGDDKKQYDAAGFLQLIH
jgi:gliding motility-associated-like protein